MMLARYSLALLAIILPTILPTYSVAQQGPPRVVRLSSQVSIGPFEESSGMLILSQTSSEFVFGELNVKKMPCLKGDPTREGGFFGLYMNTPTTETKPIIMFNTTCTLGHMHIDFPMPAGTWLIEPLTVYVYLEGDDGLDAFTAGNTCYYLLRIEYRKKRKVRKVSRAVSGMPNRPFDKASPFPM